MPEGDRIETAVQRIKRNIDAAKAIKAEIEKIKEKQRLAAQQE